MTSLQPSAQEKLEAKIEQLTVQLAKLNETQRRRDELFEEITPILKLVVGVATEQLSALEQKGYFAFGKSLLDVADSIVTGYSPNDVRELAESIVTILDTIRALTQPHALQVMREAGEVVEQSETMEPVGFVGTLKASREESVQRGMAVMLEVLRHVGKGAKLADRRERLRSQLAARRTHELAPRQRSLLQTSVPRTTAAAAGSGEKRPRAASANAAAAGGKTVTPTAPDVQFTAEGFLVDPAQWNRDVAIVIARSLDVELSDRHWSLVQAARADFEQTRSSPNIRRLTKIAGIDTKEVYSLFPKAPGKCCAMIAGLPKPVGCI